MNFPKGLYAFLLFPLVAGLAGSCTLFSSVSEVLSRQHGRFRISINCETESSSYAQYLRVNIGSREIYKTFTRDFDTIHDCSSSLSKIEVNEESVISLPFHDKTQIYFVEAMTQFSELGLLPYVKRSEIVSADPFKPISMVSFKKLSLDCSIDFKNFTYPSAIAPGERFTLVDGKLEPTRDPDGRVDKMGYSLIGEDYGDVAGDPKKEAIITLGLITGGSAAPSVVYVFEILDEEARLLWTYTAGDRADGGLRNIFASEGDLIMEEYEPSETSGACCPTSYTSSRYQWVSDSFLPAERRRNIPNPNASAEFVGKNPVCE